MTLVLLAVMLSGAGVLAHGMLPPRLRGTTRELVVILVVNGLVFALLITGVIVEVRR